MRIVGMLFTVTAAAKQPSLAWAAYCLVWCSWNKIAIAISAEQAATQASPQS